MIPLLLDIEQCSYRSLIGVGGIGTGVFFSISEDHTLGREESRAGHFLDRKDYCKLHIITHYVKALLGEEFAVFPIGKVGDDPEGQQLLREMAEIGLDLRYVEALPNGRTQFSFCFIYPDGSGGNLTTDDSANAAVDETYVQQCEPHFAEFQGRGIALAAPEVSLAARVRLLQLGSKYGFFRVASLTAEEAGASTAVELLRVTDLLAVNLSEAVALVSLIGGQPDPLFVIESTVEELCKIKPDILLSVTAGKSGSWSWNGKEIHFSPAIQTQTVSTAGAGDAYLAGLLTGWVAGLGLHYAQELGTLVASLSVSSPHTINPLIDRFSLLDFALQHNLSLSTPVAKLLKPQPYTT
jgi:sugar/nucleoside kinase (ribokinase family)